MNEFVDEEKFKELVKGESVPVKQCFKNVAKLEQVIRNSLTRQLVPQLNQEEQKPSQEQQPSNLFVPQPQSTNDQRTTNIWI